MFIRRAIAAEWPAIVSLVNEAYRGEAAASNWTSEAGLVAGHRTSLDLLAAELTGPADRRVLTLRANRGGPLLGCMMLQWTDAATVTLGMLSIAPEAQNRGLGKRLIAAAEAFSREAGARQVKITVIQLRETLIAWYERHGFVRTGATLPFPYGDDRFGVPQRDDLHFVVLAKPVA